MGAGTVRAGRSMRTLIRVAWWLDNQRWFGIGIVTIILVLFLNLGVWAVIR